jgi:EmrB/QacA subfamily drug resistance transporter
MKDSSQRSKWLVLATVCFGLFMINLDGNVVNLAMPTIIRDFGARLSQLEWISNAYMLTFAVFLITLGRLGDQIGRKRLFLAGMVFFTLGSALCGSARNVSQLIAFRVVQGIGGSAMMPATLSLITASFEKEERGRAMGFWGAVSGLAFIMGPIVGGYLTQSGLGTAINSFFGLSQLWRYVFYINVPFGVLAFIFGLCVLPESRDEGAKHRLDVAGVVLSSVAVFLLTFAFVEGPRYGWWKSVRPFAVGGLTVQPFGLSIVPLLLAGAVLLGAAFLLHEKRRRTEPLMDLSLFSNRNYSVGMLTGVILNFALMGAMFLVPLYCQSVLGIDPVHTGTLMLPFALALLVTSPLAGILSDRLGGKYVLVVGLAVLAVSNFLIGRFRVDTRPLDLLLPFVVMGVGMGLSMTPLTNLTLYGVAPAKAGGASGVLSTMRQIGAVMGVAVFSVFLQTGMASSIGVHAREVPGLPPAGQKVLVSYVAGGGLYGIPGDAEHGLAAELSAALRPVGGAASAADPVKAARMMKDMGAGIDAAMKASFTDSINQTFFIAALIGFGAVGASLLVSGKRKTRAEVRELPLGARAASRDDEQEKMAVGE